MFKIAPLAHQNFRYGVTRLMPGIAWAIAWNFAWITSLLVGPSAALSAQADTAGDKDKAKLEVLSFVDEAFLRTKPKLSWGRDPFYRTPGYLRGQPVQNDTLALTAIIFNRVKQAALINGQVVRKGTVLASGAVVTDIQPNYVLIQDGSSLRELTLPETDESDRASGKDAPPESAQTEREGGDNDSKQSKLGKLLSPEEPVQGKKGEAE